MNDSVIIALSILGLVLIAPLVWLLIDPPKEQPLNTDIEPEKNNPNYHEFMDYY